MDNENEKRTSLHLYGGMGAFGARLLAGFIVWCTFNYSMSDTMRGWFFVWAVLLSL